MVVFLLLVIVAILLFGASAITGAVMSVGRLALGVLVLAIVIGLFSDLPSWCWLIIGGLMVAGLIGLIWIFAEAAEDEAKGRAAQSDILETYRREAEARARSGDER